MIDQLIEVLDSENVLDRKKDITTLKVVLSGEGVRYLSEVRGEMYIQGLHAPKFIQDERGNIHEFTHNLVLISAA